MRAISAVMEDANAFPTGLFWGLRPGEEPHHNVSDLAAKYPRRFQLFQSPSFDSFMVELHSRLGLKLPRTILQPYEAVKERFASLVGGADSDSSLNETIRSHIVELKKQLGRPWANASDLASFDLLQAQLALGQRNHETALEYASNYCQERPEDPAGLTTWGDALALKAEAESCDAAGADAVAKWQAAIALDPETLPARNSLARYFLRARKTSEFLQTAGELLTRTPNDRALRRTVVQVYQQVGRTADALRELDILTDREPDAPDLLAMRCSVYEQRGLIAEGIKAIERAVQLEPGNAWYHFIYANGLLQTARHLDAEREYRRAVELDGSNLAFRLQIARFYAMRQQLLSAIEHLEAARTIEPDSGEVRGWLAEVYLFQDRLEDGRREVLQALRLSPGDARILVNSGIIHLRLGLPREAEEALSSAAAANTGVPQPLYWLTLLFWTQDRQADMKVTRDQLSRMAPAVGQQLDGLISLLGMRALMNPAKRLQVLEEYLRAASGPPPVPSQPAAGWKAGVTPEGLSNGWTETIRSALAKLRG
jgi:tetratricopeptide (TPR) repeat protein